MEKDSQSVEQQQQQQQNQSAVNQAKSDFALAVDLADKIRTKVTNYPHPIRSEPPLPHGFVEGGIVGCFTYLALRPIRSQAMKWVGRSSQWAYTKPYVAIFITAGQVLMGAKMALYSAVMVGSHSWLSTLTDFGNTPISDNNVNNNSNNTNINMNNLKRSANLHKSILADELCQEPIMQQLLAKTPPLSPSTNNNNQNISSSSASFQEWVMDPQKVVTDELFRAVQSCRNRQK